MKNIMKKGIFCISLAIALTACQSTGELKPVSQVKPGAVSEGTLANNKLITDTKAALENLPQGLGISASAKILKFVIQQPVGNPGSRAWREMWISGPEGVRKQYLITFRETGSNSADFQIQPMNKGQ
jgi:hypothetical protein